MYPVPLTYFFNFAHIDANARPWILAELAEAGAKHLVLTDSLLADILKDAAQLNAIEKEMADAGLDFVDSHAQFGIEIDMNLQQTAQRRMMIARHKLALEIAHYFHVETMTIHVGNNRTQELATLPLQNHIDAVTDSLAQLLPTAEELGITICIENIWTQTTTPERLLDWKKMFPTEALGFCYDAGHANIMANGRNFAESSAHISWRYTTPNTPPWEEHAIDKMLPHIVTCHLHDNTGEKDQHQLPGNGCVDWQNVREKLMQAPRLKCIQSEVTVTPNKITLPQLCRTFEKLFPECQAL